MCRPTCIPRGHVCLQQLNKHRSSSSCFVNELPPVMESTWSKFRAYNSRSLSQVDVMCFVGNRHGTVCAFVHACVCVLQMGINGTWCLRGKQMLNSLNGFGVVVELHVP